LLNTAIIEGIGMKKRKLLEKILAGSKNIRFVEAI